MFKETKRISTITTFALLSIASVTSFATEVVVRDAGGGPDLGTFQADVESFNSNQLILRADEFQSGSSGKIACSNRTSAQSIQVGSGAPVQTISIFSDCRAQGSLGIDATSLAYLAGSSSNTGNASIRGTVSGIEITPPTTLPPTTTAEIAYRLNVVGGEPSDFTPPTTFQVNWTPEPQAGACPGSIPTGATAPALTQLNLDSRSGEWSERFGSNWPSDNASQPMAVNTDQFRSMSFRTTGEGITGKLTLQATAINGGNAVIKFSTECGDFAGATDIFTPCAKLTTGNFGSITWEQTVGSVDIAICRLQPNTNYYLNITYAIPGQLENSSCENSGCSALYGPDAS